MVDYVGTKKANTFHGTEDGDTLSGGKGNDKLYGEGGDDRLNGDEGDDLLDGGAGNDVCYGGTGNDTFFGGSGDDLLVADGGTATMNGGADNDRIFTSSTLGFSINSIVNGGSGNDVIDDSSQSRGTTVDGGAGMDRYVLYRHETLTHGATIDFTPGQSAKITLPDGTNFKNIEFLDFNGGSGNDTYTIHNPIIDSGGSGNLFNGNDGIDTLRVYMKNATTTITSGNSQGQYFVNQNMDGTFVSVVYADAQSTENYTIESGSGDDFLDGGDATDILRGYGGADRLNGFLGNNTLEGGGGDDRINNSGKHSTLSGGSGNDYITESPEARDSTIDGGSDIDKLRIDRSALNTKVDFTFTPGSHDVYTLSDGTTFTNVEILDITTGSKNDSLTFIHPVTNDALEGGNHWSAGDGIDTLTVDISDLDVKVDLTVSGGFSLTRQDTFVSIVYGDGVEKFNVTGSQGDNLLNGGLSNDILDGQGGNDTVAGSHGNDTLSGGAGNDFVIGGEGDDTLSGGTKVDFIRGGAGVDTISGGSGKDTFAYSSTVDSSGSTFDTVTDFDAEDDVFGASFGISGVDAAQTAATFAKIGNVLDASHLDAHHAALVTVTKSGDLFLVLDANGQAGYQVGDDLIIRLQNATHLGQLDADNFTF